MGVKSVGPRMVNPQDESLNRNVSVSQRSSVFLDTLRESGSDQRKQACEELLQQIDVVGDSLKKAPTPQGVKRYKQLITAFMKETLNKSYELNSETNWDFRGNRKTMVTVKQINQSLEELMDQVVNQEEQQLRIVARLDEIRGMLLDLYL